MKAQLPLRPNEELLLQTVRAAPDPVRLGALLARTDFDWRPFWTLAGDQHVQPLVARVLADSRLACMLPDEARETMTAVRRQTTLHNMSTDAELNRIGAILAAAAIPFAPLKGTQLTRRLFGGLDARRCGDIDILVAESHWQAAHTLLTGAGYQPAAEVRPGVESHAFHGVPLVRVGNGQAFIVELHRKLTDPRFVTIDYRELWQRLEPAESGPPGQMELPAADLLVFLAIHAPKHSTGILRLLADIDHLIAREADRLDWQSVIRLARDWHADTILACVLQLATALLETPVPDDAIQALRPARWKRVTIPFLVGPETILHPPAAAHLRAKRFRIAYCLMLQRSGRELRSYWHYIMMPPSLRPEHALARVSLAIRQPLDGLAWTALTLASATRDRVRSRAPT
ncbi:MAG TPA: nucleotidyltransferase family protein [Thermomicrobiales bacterium]|nr:nucleotidyltransferase family protein [Thermomicrobiales bacterium]